MDPTTTYRNLLTAFDSDDHDTALELAEALAEWLERGGFWPERCSRTVVRACLEKILGRPLNVASAALPLFELGSTVITPAALDRLPAAEVQSALARHVTGDWGDLDDDDLAANAAAIADGSRIFSVYHASDGTKFYVITEADRSSTCVLLPEDY
ncbi:MAG: hypothetical protein R3C19_25350 [Planctomycetaceae bacterium]